MRSLCVVSKPLQSPYLFNSWKSRESFKDDSERMEEIGGRMVKILKVLTRICVFCLHSPGLESALVPYGSEGGGTTLTSSCTHCDQEAIMIIAKDIQDRLPPLKDPTVIEGAQSLRVLGFAVG